MHSPSTGTGSQHQSATSPARGSSSSEDPLPKLKRTSLLLNELKCLTAQQQALQQQALHQAALHLKHHNDLPQPISQQQQPSQAEASTLFHADGDEHVRAGASVGRVQIDDHDSQSHLSLLVVADKIFKPPSLIAISVNDNAECSSLMSEEQTQRLEKVKDLSFQKDGLDGCKNLLRLGNSKPKLKGLESGVDDEMDFQFTGALATREENIKGLKAGLIHVAHKMPKNAHAHFVLGLMYQRLEQPAKAASAFQKADEILKKAEEELGQNRAQLLAIVQCHHAVSTLQAKITGKICLGTDLQSSEIESWLKDLKLAVQTDPCHLLVWNTLGLVLLQTGQIQSAISILRSLLCAVPNSLDALANLGVAYFHSGHLADAARCLQLLLEKDHSHPGALSNYGTLLLCQHGSSSAGAGAGAGRANAPENVAVATALKCLTAALKSNPKAGHLWVILAAAYSMLNDSFSTIKCLEQASKLEPTRLSTRYAVAMQRVRESQCSFAPAEQLAWAANEMASILRVGDSTRIQPHIAWVGLATVNRMQHEVIAAFEGDEADLRETKARAFHTLQQAVEQNPHDPIQWQQLGLYTLCTLQFRMAQGFFKTAIAQRQTCGAIWSNLGISLQLSDELALAEEVYEKALSLVPRDKAHSILSNLGNLYRQQGHFTDAHVAFQKALEICPNYAPACNNLGLLLVVEGKFDEAIQMFDCALLSDSVLDAAKSNKMKAQALARLHDSKTRSKLGSNGTPCASKCSSYQCTQMCNS